jgi:DNA-binding response OmpR family regulator
LTVFPLRFKTKKMPSKKILIIDDEKDLTTLTAKRIRASGYDVQCYFEGKDAVDVIREAHPDLILLDLKLPDVSGMDIYRDVKQNDDLRAIPIIFISAMHKEQEYCLNVLGAEGFITKPYDPKILLTTIETALTP